MNEDLRVVQWYPGHMAKARRLMNEKIGLIDVVFELLDARLPLSSVNPFIEEICKNKPRIILLNKEDLADPVMTNRFIDHYKKLGLHVVSINSTTKKGIDKALQLARDAYEPTREKRRAKGLLDRPIRAMIVGVPNVGKSTLINKLVSKKVAVTGDKAGITKTNQWIKINKDIELLDTPGILWNKFDTIEQGYKLALSGAIKKEILPLDDVIIFGIKFMKEYYLQNFNTRYNITEDLEDPIEIIEHIGRVRGCLLRNKEIDYDRVYNLFLNDLKDGYLGRITYDRVDD